MVTRLADAGAQPGTLGWRSVLPYAAAVLAAVLFATEIYAAMLDHGHAWWRLFAWQLVGWVFWAVVAGPVLRRGAALEEPAARSVSGWTREVGCALAMTAAQVVAVALGAGLLQPFWPIQVGSHLELLQGSLGRWALTDLLLYALLLAAGWVQAAHQRSRRLELRQARLAADLAEARLTALRLEIQPHFLFNALNSIAALLRRRDAERGLDMLLGLAELLRATLERADRPEVPLREEVAFLRRYLDLEQTRFADRLAVEYAIDPAALEVLVPTLFLQPLAENALRHGLARSAAGGRLEVAATRRGDRLTVTVRDDGPGLPLGFELERDAGLGLGNTRTRLARLYGEAARLSVRRRPTGGTEVDVELPAPARQAVGA